MAAQKTDRTHHQAGPQLMPGSAPPGKESPLTALTPRQLEVLDLLTAGMTNRHIARALGITEKTVKNHMQAIFARLHVSDRTQAAVFAVRHNNAA